VASRATSNQNVTKGSGPVKVMFNNTSKDRGAGFDVANADWYPNTHVGSVKLSACVYFDSGLSVGDIISLRIYKNGSLLNARQYIAQATFGAVSISDVVDDCVWGESYSVYIDVAGSGTAVILTSNASTFFMGSSG
jgi:hypothetical protein